MLRICFQTRKKGGARRHGEDLAKVLSRKPPGGCDCVTESQCKAMHTQDLHPDEARAGYELTSERLELFTQVPCRQHEPKASTVLTASAPPNPRGPRTDSKTPLHAVN